ncbi:MAG: CvpA family protein [Tumebacillaceae bacterium]
MTVLDIVILVFVLLAALNGWRTGLVRQVVSLVGVVLGYVISRSAYGVLVPVVTKFIKLPVDTHNPLKSFMQGQLQACIAFVLLFLVTFWAVKIVGHLLDSVAKLPGLSLVNRVAGLALGGILAIFIVALLMNVLNLVSNLSVQHVLKGSQVAQYLIWQFGGVMPHSSSF